MIPPFFIGRGIEVFGLESLYFISILFLCLTIYFKTKQVYDLTKHKGVYHFRNIFLYFSLAYLFRLLQVLLSLSVIPSPPSPLFHAVNLIFMGYTSTMALFSAIMTIASRYIKLDNKKQLIANILSLIICIIAFFTRSPEILAFTQLVMIVLALIVFLKESSLKHYLFSKMRIIYLLILLFWIINLFLFNTFLRSWIKLPLYFVSLWLFYFIFLKVYKRLSLNAAKKKQD